MKHYEFILQISPTDYLNYYRGAVQSVIAETNSGLRVQFPAALLVKFVTGGGVTGRFILSCDDNNRCVGLERSRPST